MNTHNCAVKVFDDICAKVIDRRGTLLRTYVDARIRRWQMMHGWNQGTVRNHPCSDVLFDYNAK